MPTYNDFRKTLLKNRGINVDLDDTYDYKSFYKNSPINAMRLANGDRKIHFTDKYKTPKHPTFSNESIYSGKNGLVGGHWIYRPNKLQRWNYRLSPSQVRRNWDIDRTLNYAADAEDEGFVLTDSYGRYPTINGIIEGGVLPTVTITGKNKSNNHRKIYLDEL